MLPCRYLDFPRGATPPTPALRPTPNDGNRKTARLIFVTREITTGESLRGGWAPMVLTPSWSGAQEISDTHSPSRGVRIGPSPVAVQHQQGCCGFLVEVSLRKQGGARQRGPGRRRTAVPVAIGLRAKRGRRVRRGVVATVPLVRRGGSTFTSTGVSTIVGTSGIPGRIGIIPAP